MRSFTHRLLSFLDKIIYVSGPSQGYRVGDTDCPRVLAPGLVDKWTLLKGRGWPPKGAVCPLKDLRPLYQPVVRKVMIFQGALKYTLFFLNLGY